MRRESLVEAKDERDRLVRRNSAENPTDRVDFVGVPRRRYLVATERQETETPFSA